MNSDFRDLLRLFNAEKVKYLIVGGYAVIRYAQPRFTGDIDLLVEPSSENAANVYTALQKFGAPVATLKPDDFSQPGYFFQMGVPPNRIDVLMSIAGVKFQDAWQRRESAKINGDEFIFIAKVDLISSKRAAGRPKDLADLIALGEK